MKKIAKVFSKVGNVLSSLIIKFFSLLVNSIIGLFKEIYRTFSYAAVGLFKTFDFIFTKLITIFSYLIYGIIFIFKWIGKITLWIGTFVYKYILRTIGIEIYSLGRAIGKGAFWSGKKIFYELPLFIINSFSDFFDYLSRKFKTTKERIVYFFKNTPKKIKTYFINKWNNLAIVKHYRNKKERELEVLLIDKFGKDAERSEKKQTFQYLARNGEGKLIKGYFSALSKLDTHSYLLDAGYEVYEIKTNWWINFTHNESTYLDRPMKNKDLIFWLAQLSTYIKSGIPLTDAVKILAEQDKRKKYKKVYDSVVYELSVGEAFSEALKKQGNVFPPLLINMVKASELIGDLESTLDDMSAYYEEKEITRKQMISALTYPSIILILAVVVVSFMLIYIVPQFADIYSGLGSEVGGMTQWLLNLSAFMKNNATVMLLILIVFLLLYRYLFKKVKAFRTFMQYIYMHIPVVGNLIIYNEMNLFAKTFAVLNKNNILLTDSIDILSKITENEFYKMIMYDTISNLLRGEKISLSFKNNWAVPTLAYYMITTGESTGELSTMLEKVSEYYQREQRSLANTLKTLIEPFLMVFLAGVVGGIMIAVLVPMYDVSNEVLNPSTSHNTTVTFD